ncbi:response regulator [Aliiruegeria lutimaris]|uniref:Response regulator receiver domain-containing protein n=1 Tax=Aliiruegeria lutimaris TaxID=571298 RepID=A0A1G8V0N2_9RHOB|nr:response regulator [Aliiruegeria lutimaris]SDJ59417.1 Response regulator receiver domain-containing protein [Aliiruegeria lutimaris]
MTDELTSRLNARRPTPERPLLGLTVLVVEDSRFACEAIRLLCLRSGARIRRADCIASAHRHLAVYRPSAVIVDMGLPDGSGADLIRELAESDQRVPVILGTSGESAAETDALAAGADGFLEKPITSLASFQQAVLAHLPPDEHPRGPRMVSADRIDPDPIALRDDLSHIASVIAHPMDSDQIEYVAQFLSSVAQSAGDSDLASAAVALQSAVHNRLPPRNALGEISDLVDTRLTGTGPS